MLYQVKYKFVHLMVNTMHVLMVLERYQTFYKDFQREKVHRKIVWELFSDYLI